VRAPREVAYATEEIRRFGVRSWKVRLPHPPALAADGTRSTALFERSGNGGCKPATASSRGCDRLSREGRRSARHGLETVTERHESRRLPISGRLPVPARAWGSQVAATPGAAAAGEFVSPVGSREARVLSSTRAATVEALVSTPLPLGHPVPGFGCLTQMRPSSGSVVETAVRQQPSGACGVRFHESRFA